MSGMRERRRAAQEHLAQQAERVAELGARQMKPGRYRLAYLVEMVTCDDCGSVVADTEAHDEWHAALNDDTP